MESIIIFVQCRERTFTLRHQWTSYQASLYSRFETNDKNDNKEDCDDGDDEYNSNDDGEQASAESQSGHGEDQDEQAEVASLTEEDVSIEDKDNESEDDDTDEECQFSEDDKNTGRRKKRECPLPYCSSKVVHLPRHLRKVHQWSKENARTAVSRFGLRKKYQFSDTEKAMAGNRKAKKETTQRKCQKKPCRKKKLCPLTGCMTTTDRLPQHLRRKHKLEPRNAKYKRALSMAKVISRDRPHIFLRMKQERQRKLEPDVVNATAMSEDESGEEVEMVQEDSTDYHIADEGGYDSGSKASDSVDIQAEDVSKTLRSFRDWLLSPDGGKKDVKTAKQHISQVNKVLLVVGEGRQLSSLVDTKKIRDTFLQQYAAEKYHAATIKSYLMSLQHYCSFLLSDQPSGVIFDKENVLSLRERLKRWSSSYKRENTRRRWEKMEEDRSILITPDKIRKFERSQAARDAVILLGQLCGAHAIQITHEKYTLLRDYLIAQIMIDNANRAGVVACMSMKEFERATPEGDRYVVRVLNHKTVDTHGPAPRRRH